VMTTERLDHESRMSRPVPVLADDCRGQHAKKVLAVPAARPEGSRADRGYRPREAGVGRAPMMPRLREME
jgi:hypothetical protein